MSTQPRKPAGAPKAAGGQFDTVTRSTTDIDLTSPADFGGLPSIAEGARTPWGAAQTVTPIGPGIVRVETAVHGGFKLSPQRNALIPPALRNGNGWYEEDTEAHIVVMTFPDLYDGDRRARAEQSVKDWFPDEYEKAFGVTLGPADSHTRARLAERNSLEAFRATHANDFVTTSGGHPAWCPIGFEVITVERRATGVTRHLLVKAGFWSRHETDRTDTPIVVDADSHPDVTDLVTAGDALDHRPAPPKTHNLGIDTSGLTPAAAARATAELNTRYRYRDGTVCTVAERLATVGVHGKAASHDGTSATYFVDLGDSYVTEVSKATFDALTSVPNTMTALDQARFRRTQAQVKRDRAHERVQATRIDSPLLSAARAAHAKAYADAEAAAQEVNDLQAADHARIAAANSDLQAQALARLAEHRS